ncbi:uncharacterized protein LACBIDRAFT_331407 [Laccaria bicolor S238N-H82]|uniref:Predicted protein n=1 Tax=Laccaria bicolor (strain S238N-H82 / ATCC MYA-4686) TaxID=486041 RepID=B0DPD9_LACBS|nr:uncharacterized protein LACBIDRAFT_331407 [Laccaria bicolor S238N-H82]EDR03600.1 predicted protein [Laccaria bicolor S238N-H82]|eukprot:XP_001885748.1 predicted protein [Laccaria bicolor S238N-H82]
MNFEVSTFLLARRRQYALKKLTSHGCPPGSRRSERSDASSLGRGERTFLTSTSMITSSFASAAQLGHFHPSVHRPGDIAMVESTLCTELVDPASPLRQQPLQIPHTEQFGEQFGQPYHKRKLESQSWRVRITPSVLVPQHQCNPQLVMAPCLAQLGHLYPFIISLFFQVVSLNRGRPGITKVLVSSAARPGAIAIGAGPTDPSTSHLSVSPVLPFRASTRLLLVRRRSSRSNEAFRSFNSALPYLGLRLGCSSLCGL